MSIQGSTLKHPIQPDQRGTLGVISSKREIIEDSIRAIIETRQGERVMLPDYGIPDFVFDVLDAGFTARMAYFVEQQIQKYEPLVDQVHTIVGYLERNDRFVRGYVENQQIAAFQIEYVERGSNTLGNLVFPTWQLRGE